MDSPMPLVVVGHGTHAALVRCLECLVFHEVVVVYGPETVLVVDRWPRADEVRSSRLRQSVYNVTESHRCPRNHVMRRSRLGSALRSHHRQREALIGKTK